MAMTTACACRPPSRPARSWSCRCCATSRKTPRCCAYCEELVTALSRERLFGQPVRALLDTKKIKSAEKRWNWVRRGAPIIVEIGPRDAAAGQVTYMRRDAPARRRQDQIHRQAAPGFPGRRRAASGRDPGRSLCRSQGAAGRQHQERRHRLEGRGGLFRRQ